MPTGSNRIRFALAKEPIPRPLNKFHGSSFLTRLPYILRKSKWRYAPIPMVGDLAGGALTGLLLHYAQL
jgi:hypothetical protein